MCTGERSGDLRRRRVTASRRDRLAGRCGPHFNDLTLRWTGGTPTFSVYAAFTPATLVQPVNLQAVVASSPWTDVAAVIPAGTVLFYRVVATPATCGNGAVEGPEGCDDGNLVPGDGCSAVCGVETGYTCAGSPSVCSALCGDGIVAAGESCDDANNNNGDGCSAVCSVDYSVASRSVRLRRRPSRHRLRQRQEVRDRRPRCDRAPGHPAQTDHAVQPMAGRCDEICSTTTTDRNSGSAGTRRR